MDIISAHRVIQQRWLDRWPTLAPGIAFVFDNDVRPEEAYFARMAIVSGTSEQYTLGSRPGNVKVQHLGYIEVRIVGPMDRGRGEIDALVKKAFTIYQLKRLGVRAGEHGVVCHVSSLAELRRDAERGKSWVVTVTTPFEFYEVV